MPEARLEVTDTLGRHWVSITKDVVTLGRRNENDVVVSAAGVSRDHAEIRRDGDRYVIRDLQSRFGTFVNGEPVSTECELQHGDRIRLGRGGEAELLFWGDRVVHLKVLLPSGETLDQEVVAWPTTIGRSARCAVVIPDASISREHAVLLRRHGQILIKDLSSRYGVRVNGDRITGSVPLSFGDEILLGTCKGVLVLEEERSVPLTCGLIESPRDEETQVGIMQGFVGGVGAEARSVEALPPLADLAGLVDAGDLYRQLDRARSIQRLLLPRVTPRLPGYRLFAESQPCYAVGGDFFDFIEVRDGGIGLVLGDVSGKGVGAALLAHFTQAVIRTALKYDSALERILPAVNREICERSLLNQFVTACVCILDPTSGYLHYINAGHCPPFIVGRGAEPCFLAGGSPVLGVSPDFAYDVQHTRLEPESAIVLYSDGFTECTNGDSVEFGRDRLAHFFASRATVSPELVLRDLENDLERFGVTGSQTDDMTLLVVQRDGGMEMRPNSSLNAFGKEIVLDRLRARLWRLFQRVRYKARG